MRSTTLTILALLLLSALLSAAAKPAAPQPQPDKTYFRPGAAVTLELTIKSPEDWKLNHMVPIRLAFDKDQLKGKAFTTAKDYYDYNLKAYVKQHTVSIPITLSSKTPDGMLSIPVDIQCSICDDPGTQCTFANERMIVTLNVRAKAPQGTNAAPLAKGKVTAGYRLSAP